MPYVTDRNYSPLIETISYFCLAASVFAVVARFITKRYVIHATGLDDYFAAVSLVFGIGQTVAILIGASAGLGKADSFLDHQKTDKIFKAEYAANFLYILSLCFAKLSVLGLLRSLTPSLRNQYTMTGLEALIAIWGITAIFANAFMCHLPQPWNYTSNKCLDQSAFWNYFEIANIITDAGLILLPLPIVWKLWNSFKRKAAIMSAFSFRLGPIAAIVCKLVYWRRLFGTDNPIFNLWPVVICTQTIQCAEIMATCALYLRPFLKILQNGFLNLHDPHPQDSLGPLTLGSIDVSKTVAVNRSVANAPPVMGKIEGLSNKGSDEDVDEIGNFATAQAPVQPFETLDMTRDVHRRV